MRVWNILVGVSLLAFILGSCASKKDILYLQDIDKIELANESEYFSAKIQSNDILSIVVSAQDSEAAKPFNVTSTSNVEGVSSGVTYLVDELGMINFPIIGQVKASNFSSLELSNNIEEALKEYIINPNVSVRIENFKVTVLGSVERPGTFQVANERITLLEAIGLAGDLNIYGKRNDILILREKDGVKTYKKVDLTRSDFLSSDYYYLNQNDVIIVSPNFYEVQRSASNPNNRLYISLASLAISLIVLFTR